MKKTIPRLIPFLILAGITVYSLVEFIVNSYIPTWKHYVAFVLIVINAILLFYRIRPAVLATGVILVLGTFNMLSFFAVTNTVSYGIGSISTPEMQLSMLGLLVLYGFLNFHFFVEWHLDSKYGPSDK